MTRSSLKHDERSPKSIAYNFYLAFHWAENYTQSKIHMYIIKLSWTYGMCGWAYVCVYTCACLCVCAQAVLMLGHVHVVSAEFILPSLEFQTSQQHPTQPMVTHHIHQPTQTKPKLFTCLSIMQSISSIKSKNTCNICPTRRHTHNMINILHC